MPVGAAIDVVTFVVPEPSLYSEWMPVSPVPEKLTVPGPRTARMRLLTVNATPPVTLSVAPAAAPMPASWFAESVPATVLAPERLCSTPRPPKPLYKPVWAPAVERLRLTGLGSVMPPESCSAAPWLVPMPTMFVAAPSAAASVIRTAPWSIWRPPVSTWADALGAVIEAFQAALPAVASRSVPLSALVTLVVAEAPPNGLVSVSVAPGTASRTFVPEASWIVRAVEKLPAARRPAVEESTIWLAASPRASSLVAASRPAVTATLPVNELVAFESTSVPAPDLARPKEPETGPASVRPCTTLEAVAVSTLNVPTPVSVVAPLKSAP